MSRHNHGVFPLDSRSDLTGAADPALLATIVESWPSPSMMPSTTERYWTRAGGLFRSGATEYENFTEAVRIGFSAVEAALRHHIADLISNDERATLGQLIRRADDAGRLKPRQSEWLSQYALRFRNELTHADESDPLVLTPAMAAEMLEGIGRFLAELTDEP